ncbi:hypothetical protein PspLS_01750 [Pyricularia sp. CBS 133598]|nr:hypothetical protein PspLS_01750 [Pyricularia sp. CBS 133598]
MTRPNGPRFSFVSYEPFVFPDANVNLRVTLEGQEISVPVPEKTEPFQGQISYGSQVTYNPQAFGPTTRAIARGLGPYQVGRKGIKGRRRAVSARGQRVRVVGSKERYTIERFEIPHLKCLHFLVKGTKGLLEGGVSSIYRLDSLAESFDEYIRTSFCAFGLHAPFYSDIFTINFAYTLQVGGTQIFTKESWAGGGFETSYRKAQYRFCFDDM